MQFENTVGENTFNPYQIEAQSTMLKKEMQDHAASCAAEAERLREDAERKTLNLDMTENEAEEYLKVFFWSHLFYFTVALLLSIYTLDV